MSQENVEVVLRLSEANARRDWDAVYATYAPDIEWEDTSGLWGDWGVARGREGLREAWRRRFEAFESRNGGAGPGLSRAGQGPEGRRTAGLAPVRGIVVPTARVVNGPGCSPTCATTPSAVRVRVSAGAMIETERP